MDGKRGGRARILEISPLVAGTDLMLGSAVQH